METTESPSVLPVSRGPTTKGAKPIILLSYRIWLSMFAQETKIQNTFKMFDPDCVSVTSDLVCISSGNSGNINMAATKKKRQQKQKKLWGQLSF